MLIGLYETTIEQTDTGGDYDVAPGCQFSFELNLTDSIEITVLQMGADQDFSLRCHISKEPGGTSVDLSTPIVSWWSARRVENFKHVLWTSSEPATGLIPLHKVQLEPGTYYLNVLNMSNELNEFRVILNGNAL